MRLPVVLLRLRRRPLLRWLLLLIARRLLFLLLATSIAVSSVLAQQPVADTLVAKPYLLAGLLGEKRFGVARAFINAENLVVNGGVRVAF